MNRLLDTLICPSILEARGWRLGAMAYRSRGRA
jgi:hypothetical protein